MKYRTLKSIIVTIDYKPNTEGIRHVFEAIQIESNPGTFGMPGDTQFAVVANGVYVPTLTAETAIKAAQGLAAQATRTDSEPANGRLYEA